MQAYNTTTSETDFHFQYPIQSDPSLKALRRAVNLTLDPALTLFEKTQAIIGYAHGLFAHDGTNIPSANDPLTILTEAQAGQSFRCVEYSTLAAGLLWAFDIPARTVGLKTSDVETRKYGAGHVVIEFWNKDFDKWVLCDVQAGVIPQLKNVPISAYELSQTTSVTYLPLPGSAFTPEPYDDKANYTDWIHEYLYFIDTPVVLTLGNEEKSSQQIAMLVPEGVNSPMLFQGKFQMNALYTHSVLDLYPNAGSL